MVHNITLSLLTSMRSFMFNGVVVLRERQISHITDVRLFFIVRSFTSPECVDAFNYFKPYVV